MNDSTVTYIAELVNDSTETRYQIDYEGRLLVRDRYGVEREQVPMSYWEHGSQRVSAQGMIRLREAYEAAGFFALASELTAAHDCEQPQRLRFGALGPDGWHSVAITASLEEPTSLGPLQPVYVAFDREALGAWRHG